MNRSWRAAGRSRFLFLMITAGLLLACKLVTPPEVSTEARAAPPPDCPVCQEIPRTDRASFSARLLQYYERLTRLSELGLREEYRHVEDGEHGILPGRPDRRLRLALLLSLPETEFRDDGRAVDLLNDYLEENRNHDADVPIFAVFLLETLEERQRQQQAVDALKRSLADAQTQRENLEKQLEQLKAIEQNMQNREDSLIVPIIEDNTKAGAEGRAPTDDTPDDDRNDKAKDSAGRR